LDGYLLDTNVLATLLAPEDPAREAIAKRLASLADSHVSVSVAALAELEVGCSLGSKDRDDARREISEVVHGSGLKVRDFTEHSAAVYGELKAKLMIKYNRQHHRRGAKRPEEWPLPDKAGKLGIDEFDLLMVTHALEYRLVLVTKEAMARIRDGLGEAATDLRLEDWST
jgi:predicted nucleic acid-binding protein